jgi:transcriptional regulator with PAS, ATPase and Fis domain
MSRLHARIHIGPPFRIEDLESANGTAVGGTSLPPGEQHPFAPDDAITAGATTMLIRAHTSGVPVSVVEGPRVEPIVSDSFRPMLELADRAAPSMISVLLLGETGVGKDVLAERIHRASPRAKGPFLRLNCAAFSPTLLASELFGHEKGAFTGATFSQPGLLQSANGGTVFLDEVGDLPLELQAKLLFVLERREVMPVGAVRPRQLDVRFLSATNRDLPKDVEAGAFRRDLYFRLNGITIAVPPLRARVPEIEGLARLFAYEAARSIGRATPELTDEALAVLRGHSWPGNVRELRTVIERAVLLGSEGVVQPQDIALAVGAALPRAVTAQMPAQAAGVNDGEGPTEQQQIRETLALCGGNQSRAAKLLGISRNTLIARIGKYGLARPLSPRNSS